MPEGYRGIQETVVGPGRYYVNTLAVTPVIIPTTNQTVEWTAEDLKGSFDPFEVISKDGFTMQLEVRVVFRVKPEDAPFMVAKIGSIDRLIQNVMHPLIDSIFRNQASESSAMAYLQNRHEEQERAEARVRTHLLKYHVDVVNVLICHIRLPEELMKTQTEKILAEQRQTMFRAQQEAEVNRIELEKTKSRADNQRDLMAATVGVEIASRRSEQRKAEGEGEAHYIRQTGQAEAEKVRLMGEAQGVAYKEQVNALGAQFHRGEEPGRYGRREAFQVHQALKDKGPVTVPREFVFLDRAAVGLGAVFLHLGAELNYHRMFNEALGDFHLDGLATNQTGALTQAGLA